MKKNTNKLSKNDPYYLKIGKFVKKTHYNLKADMGDAIKDYLLNYGKQTITEDEYINIGFNNALLKGIDSVKISKK